MVVDTFVGAMIEVVGAALVGAASGIIAVLYNQRGVNVKLITRQEDHERRFLGVDKKFDDLDQKFVPRNELDARLTGLKEGQDRIEKVLNLVLSLRTGLLNNTNIDVH